MFEKLKDWRIVSSVLMVVLISLMFTGNVAAVGMTEGFNPNFICENDNSAFVGALNWIIGAIFVLSFLFGIVGLGLDRLNKADTMDLLPGNFSDGDGMKAFLAGVSVPVLIWGASFLGAVLFNYNFSCVIPLQ